MVNDSIQVNATTYHQTYINPEEFIRSLMKRFGFENSHDTFVCVKDERLVRGEDISYHGSPHYQYEVISNNPKWIELYQSLKCLSDYFRNQSNPEWDRLI